MKASSLAKIPEPLSRFIQTTKFLRSLKITEEYAMKVRDQAVLELRDQGISQSELARRVGVTQQMISFAEKRARRRQGENDHSV